jgi:8-amino-7-oxononanoate synthase
VIEAATRSLVPQRVIQRPWVELNGKQYLDFSSNDYLALRFDCELIETYQQALAEYGIGSGGSPLVCGYDDIKAKFENAFSAFLGLPKSLLFTCGYMANLAVFSKLYATDATEIYLDKLCHASIYDGLSMRGEAHTKIIRYPHLDLTYLEKKLASSQVKQKIIVTEGIFSMSGQQAPISELVALRNKYQAKLIVDDAHCIGVKGTSGQGSQFYASQLGEEIDLVICPLGKAFAMQGAIVAGSSAEINRLIQQARPYIYSTAINSALVKTLQAGLIKIQRARNLRQMLQQNIDYFNHCKQQSELVFWGTNTAIQFLIIGEAERAVKIYQQLLENGIHCYPMRYPTVPQKYQGLRIVLSAAHTKLHIKQLFDQLERHL